MRSVAFALLALCAVPLGCAAAPPRPAAPADPMARDDAHLIAQEAVDARVTMALHIDRVAHFRFAQYLVKLGGWAEALDGTGIDPLRDVQRAFIAAHTSHLGQVVVVLQHTADEARVKEALAALQRSFRETHGPRPAPANGGGDSDQSVFSTRLNALEDRVAGLSMRFADPSRLPFPAAYRILDEEFTHSDGPVLIAAPHPGLLVVLPPERVFAAFRMMEVAGLPSPSADEAMVFRAWDPESSIQNGPAWSRDVRYAEAVFALDATGGGMLRFRAVCTSPAAARVQAQVMTDQVERAQTLSIGGAKVRLFDQIEFRAERDRVKMRTRLFAQDVDWIVGMTMRPL
jgi:hypothetical protein